MPTTVTTFSTPGAHTWVCPASVVAVQAECYGAGGGGYTSPGGSGAGGAGGAYAINPTLAVTPGTTYAVNVGAGGAAGASGGNSYFNTAGTINALGGAGANGVSGATAPAGSIGTTTYLGGNGGNGAISNVDGGGGGGGAATSSGAGTAGSSFTTGVGGAGGAFGGGAGGNVNVNGVAGTAPGGAGGGGGGTALGAAGANGQVVITYTINSNHDQCLLSAQAVIQSLTMTGSPTVTIQKTANDRRLGISKTVALPAIVLVPVTETMNPNAGVTGFDDVGYGVLCCIVAADNQEPTQSANLDQYLTWRQQIAKVFRNQPHTMVAAGATTVRNVFVEPGDAVVPAAWRSNYFVSALVLRFISRESRGAS